MNIAQTLYEGVELGSEGAEGLITYMRTDSVRLAPEAIDAARKFIDKNYGKNTSPTLLVIIRQKKAPKMPTKRSALPAYNTLLRRFKNTSPPINSNSTPSSGAVSLPPR